MGLTNLQCSTIEKARAGGAAELAVELSDDVCVYLLAVIARDLGLSNKFRELPQTVPDFFSDTQPEELILKGFDFWKLMSRLVDADAEGPTYFSCLATLHKARLKYLKILERQPIPTMDQVGPRGLLQYGSMSAKALTVFMLWRKWLYDIDNRAAQETGYLFEPIIAHSIGGTPFSASKSPIRRHQDGKRGGRQVDCVRAKRAYELKMRVTIAASGQGRWGEELAFPNDCRHSGYTPVLVVFDPTENPKLSELKKAFLAANGEVYVGKDAWRHLEEAAGKTMGTFLDKYVRSPMQNLLSEVPNGSLPELTMSLDDAAFRMTVAGERVAIYRATPNPDLLDAKVIPEDVDEETSGP